MPLGRQMLGIATRQAAEWQRYCPGGLRVAVNVSARQFLDPALTADIESALAESGLEAALLDIEVTETATLLHAREADAVLARLRSVGVAVSLDDFGTGYSSLSQLRTLPISRLKIDRSFVSEIEESASSAAIVRAVIDLGRALGLGVVAEGVETADSSSSCAGDTATRSRGTCWRGPCRPTSANGCSSRPPRRSSVATPSPLFPGGGTLAEGRRRPVAPAGALRGARPSCLARTCADGACAAAARLRQSPLRVSTSRGGARTHGGDDAKEASPWIPRPSAPTPAVTW